MKLTEILKNVKYESRNFKDIEITGIEHDSRKIVAGNIYVCLKGLSFDGHDFAGAACSSGASCIITEKYIDGIDAVQIKAPDSRRAYSQAASNWHGNPHERLKIIAVTGTKGKTTTTHLIKTVLESTGIKTAVMGTLGTFIGGQKYEQKLTTPDPMDFHNLLGIIADEGCEYAVMELSAHALYLKKTEPVKFEIGVFTNLSHDHLDDFMTMERYMQAKKLLFEDEKCKKAVINLDDEISSEMMNGYINKTITYSAGKEADFTAKNIECGLNSISYDIEYEGSDYNVEMNIPGRFNVYNSLASIAVCLELGLNIDEVLIGLEQISSVDGRMESVDCGQRFTVIVDYAHSPDSLKNVLAAARGFTQNRVISVFGCGGDRDMKKRPVMGKVSSELADFTIITSDNPRTEDPDSIIDMIEQGMANKEYIRMTDRRQAIHTSLGMAQAGDVVVIAGKGHETYQDVMGKKHHFDDREIVREYFEEK